MEKVIVGTRSFQAGKNAETFNKKTFAKNEKAVKNLLLIEEVEKLIIVTCGGGKFAEIPNAEGVLPTVANFQKAFPDEVENKRLILHVRVNWGNNRGSATALNDSLSIAKKMGAKWTMNWSPEIECDSHLIYEALTHAERYNLFVVGALRQNWWERPQWAVPQNTFAIWDTKILSSPLVKGFASECNGTGETVTTKEYGEVSLAGMEDFHAMLKIMKNNPETFRWGMIRRLIPLKWDTNFKEDPKRELAHLKKIARQPKVMKKYAEKIFPNIPFKELMDYNFFSKQFIA
ncbi:hypothetical protein K8R32_04195 [bacterium]|nr:hypothetical protein [bacterium]